MPKSHTVALARRADAVKLFREGRTFQQIADKVGFANRGTAHRVVTTAMKDRIVEDIDELRYMEAARLDAVMAEAWEVLNAATSLEPMITLRAVETIVRIIGQRAKILGLTDHAPTQRMLINPQAGNTRKATQDAEQVQTHEKVA